MSRTAILAGLLAVFCAAGRVDAVDWKQSMVWIEATAVRYSHYQPWSSTTRTVLKNGLMVEDGKVLTTAEGLDNATLLRVRREGDGRWRLAGVDWLDPYANLALLSAGEEEAWPALHAAPLARRAPESGPVQIWYFLDGRVVSAPGTLRRVHVPRDPKRIVQHLMLEVASEAGSDAPDAGPDGPDAGDEAASQIVVAGNEVIGLGAGHDGKLLSVIPAPLVAGLLARKRHDPKATLAWYPFAWQGTQNPATTAYLGLSGAPRGVVVSALPALSPFAGASPPARPHPFHRWVQDRERRQLPRPGVRLSALRQSLDAGEVRRRLVDLRNLARWKDVLRRTLAPAGELCRRAGAGSDLRPEPGVRGRRRPRLSAAHHRLSSQLGRRVAEVGALPAALLP